ncbi:MAG: hypothetical protein AB7P97_20700 [Hyphomonadaceae bacterium]
MSMPTELFVSFDDNRARLRIDDGEVQETYWDPTGDHRALRARRPEMIFDLRDASTLHVELAPPLSSRQYMQFDLSSARAAIDRVLDACTLRGAELEAYNDWAVHQLEAAWDANLRLNEPPPLSEYSYAYTGLRRVGAIDGPPLGPNRTVLVGPGDYRNVEDRPMPAETVLRALMEYMRSSGRCIYPPDRRVTEEALAIGPPCPLTMPFRQAAVFFSTGDERIENNVQWAPRGA